MFRPDLVDVWVFRTAAVGEVQILLMRRSAGRVLPGLWQGVSGSLEPDERVVAGALRELREETGIGSDEIVALYDLDQVNQFHEPSVDGILTAAIFAVRVGPGVEPRLSHEHDQARWVGPAEALDLVVWPSYRISIARISGDLLDPARAAWFELDADGRRRIA
ncbi:MAG: NUDIX hydrolase [Candidatus Limnocylindrales bacterium]